MKDKNYNWWEDPKNKETVDRLSWWSHEENQYNAEFPIALKQSDENCWVASTTNNTEKLLGDRLTGCAQGKTKEEAIKKLFYMLKISHDFSEDCRLNYQRWVPFRKGDWKHTGGKWVVVFGFHIYFRYGKAMKGGFYIPLTKLNVSFSSEWAAYRRYRREQKN